MLNKEGALMMANLATKSGGAFLSKRRSHLGGDMSFSFSEAGSPPTPQCVFGIS